MMHLHYDSHAVNDAATILAVLVSALTLLSVFIYTIGSKGAWHRALLGIAFAALLVAPVPVLAIILLRRTALLLDWGVNGEYPGYEWVAWAGYLITTIIHLIALTAIIVEQRRSHHVPPGRDTGETTPVRPSH